LLTGAGRIDHMHRIYLRAKNLGVLSLILLIMILELPGSAAAQPLGFSMGGRRHGGSGAQDRQGYNSQTVITVKGEVEALGSYGMTGWRVAPGMQTKSLVLKTDKGDMKVNLGPPWYARKQSFYISRGDFLEVSGSQVTRDGQSQLIASQVKKDGQTLKVRDEKGTPVWREEDSGGRGSGGMGSGGRGIGGRGYTNW
jgi:hypothetical protein